YREARGWGWWLSGGGGGGDKDEVGRWCWVGVPVRRRGTSKATDVTCTCDRGQRRARDSFGADRDDLGQAACCTCTCDQCGLSRGPARNFNRNET
ncbi:hypothetical protein B296_00054726, partial [Ensete ventricosum]